MAGSAERGDSHIEYRMIMVAEINPAVHRSAFPHWLSAWWIPILLAVGLGPLECADFVYFLHPELRDQVIAFGMAWGLTIWAI